MSNSARLAFFVSGVLNAVAPRIAQHAIEIRSAHRNFGARQLRSQLGRNPPQLWIEPQAGSRRRNLCGTSATRNRRPPTFVRLADPVLEIWRPPPHPAAGHSSAFPREEDSAPRGLVPRLRLGRGGEAVHRSTASRASGASLIVRPAAEGAVHRAIAAVQGRGRRHL